MKVSALVSMVYVADTAEAVQHGYPFGKVSR